MRAKNKLSISFLVALLLSVTTLLTSAAGIITTLTITVNSQGGSGGTVTANPPGPYTYGQSVTLTANANAGSQFVEWRGDVTEAAEGWWDANFDYRVLVTVGANGFARTDKPAEAAINFTTLLSAAGQTAALDPDSIRVVEINSAAQVTDGAVPFQFDRAVDYNPKSKAAGTLIFLMKGATPASGERIYHVYFDVVGKNFTTPAFPDRVILADKDSNGIPIEDQREESYRITTVASTAPITTTYFYHTKGAGFSSMNDVNGNDWINYRSNTDGPGGTFRGIPNAVFPEGSLHPGQNNAETEMVQGGPLKETIRSRTSDGQWDVTWEIFPAYARMTMNKAGHPYWLLYEGTPGDSLVTGNGGNADVYFLSNSSTARQTQNSYSGDLPGEEWVYFADKGLNRSIFLAHHEDDSEIDSYKYQSDPGGAMTVWGFGRNNDPTGSSISTSAPHHLTIGLFDTIDYATATNLIRAAYKDLSITIGTIESRTGIANPDPGSNPSFTITMTSNRQITAIFEPQ